MKSTHGQSASCRARPMDVDDDLEDIRWIRGLGGERLPAVSYAFLANLTKSLLFAIGEGLGFFVVCFLHTSEQIFLYQGIRRLAGARHVMTGRVVNTVTRRWVGVPKERTPFRIHDAVVDFDDR